MLCLQFCTDKSLGDGKELIRFDDFDPIFKVTGGQRMLKKCFVFIISPKRIIMAKYYTCVVLEVEI